jgi:hypothetical protein
VWDTEAQRKYFRADTVSALVRGIRIHVKDGEEPSSVSARIMAIADDLTIKAEQSGVFYCPE